MFFKLENGRVVNLNNMAYYHASKIIFPACNAEGDYMSINITTNDYERLNDLLFGNKDEKAQTFKYPR